MTTCKLLAPLSGWCAPLDEVPDPVFAQRVLGDGVAVDPVDGTLYAPCDGEVISIAAAKHAVALRADNGLELLMHVGIDTVALAGDGFQPLVAAGARVRARDPLLRFDLELLAQRAKSLITPLVITNGDRFEIIAPRTGRSVTAGDELLELRALATYTDSLPTPGGAQAIERVTIPHQHGLHARPAALIANCAKQLGGELRIEAHGRHANARSAVAIMALGVRCGDEIVITATGADAAHAARELKRVILAMKEAHAAHAPPAPVSVPAPASHDARLRGVIVSRGLAVGRAVMLRVADIAVQEAGGGVAHESAELERARADVRTRLDGLVRTSKGTASEAIAAHLEFLDDWELVASARRTIARGKSAGFAWRSAVRESADALRALGDPRMSERIDDLLDLESQVLTALSGAAPAMVRDLPERAILVAEDLKPSQLVTLDAARLAGLCMAGGGPTSHVALLAAAMGVPALVALGQTVLEIPEGTWLVLDAEQGLLSVAPDQSALASAEQTLQVRQQRRQAERDAAQMPCHLADGTRIEVFANLASLAEANVAVTNGAEGCGLLRTEFLFLDRETPPDEGEQLEQYQDIAAALAGRPLIIRTLDIGGDKPIPYLPLPAEDNPALGLRGVRTSLWRPDLLRTQLRAILRVAPAGQCRILLPMITDTGELQAVRRMLDEVRRELHHVAAVQVGAMVETPACAVMAAQVARDVDFLSIGSNDLTQYTLAMDRTHSELAHRIDGLHPAVLQLIAATVRGADSHGRLTAVCGGLASEPAAVPVLIGLGVRELSVVPTLIPQLKSLVRTLTLDACRDLARQALECETAEAVRVLVNAFTISDTRVIT